MPNIAAAFKEEISRLARREIRKQTIVLRRSSAQYRKDIAEMKRRLHDLQRKVAPLGKQMLTHTPAEAPQAEEGRLRFTAKGLRSLRKRLGLSAADCGKLLGVTDQTVYNWERGQARPRQQQLANIASLRRMGKREATARLEQMKSITKKRK